LIREGLRGLPDGSSVLTGGAAGVDAAAEMVALDMGYPVEVYRARWDTFGRAAGPLRNQLMIETKPDLVLAFPLRGSSRGTMDTVRRAHEAGIAVEVVWLEEKP
jgi:DNA-binding MurR/RpiR family transcriptional regulator